MPFAYVPASDTVPELLHRCVRYEENEGGLYAVTVMLTVAADEVRPLESVTVADNEIVPDVFRNPVVRLELVPEKPPPVML